MTSNFNKLFSKLFLFTYGTLLNKQIQNPRSNIMKNVKRNFELYSIEMKIGTLFEKIKYYKNSVRHTMICIQRGRTYITRVYFTKCIIKIKWTKSLVSLNNRIIYSRNIIWYTKREEEVAAVAVVVLDEEDNRICDASKCLREFGDGKDPTEHPTTENEEKNREKLYNCSLQLLSVAFSRFQPPHLHNYELRCPHSPAILLLFYMYSNTYFIYWYFVMSYVRDARILFAFSRLVSNCFFLLSGRCSRKPEYVTCAIIRYIIRCILVFISREMKCIFKCRCKWETNSLDLSRLKPQNN